MGKNTEKINRLINRGKKIIAPELMDKWEQHVRESIADEFLQGDQLEPVLNAVERLNNGLPVEAVIKGLKEDGMDGNAFGLVINEVAAFSSRADEIREYQLINRGKKIIAPELMDKWEQHVRESIADEFLQGDQLEPVLNAVERLNNGLPVEAVIKGLKEDGMDGNALGLVINEVAEFSSRADEIRAYQEQRSVQEIQLTELREEVTGLNAVLQKIEQMCLKAKERLSQLSLFKNKGGKEEK